MPLTHESSLEVPPSELIRVSGIVQGVGFRPAVYRLAVEHGLDGAVYNDGGGLCIVVRGCHDSIDHFVRAIHAKSPPLSRIDRVERVPFRGSLEAGFHILPSRGGAARTGITPDAASCASCVAEIVRPGDRRHRYAFTNCTHCGPRFSIVRAIPYDRCNTSMESFAMCPPCEREYNDAAERRFHAQPNACPRCGPRLWFEAAAGTASMQQLPGDDALAQAARLLRSGGIVAIKGLGGFHLACDATNEATVERLRLRKKRYDKPFALMARDLAMIERYCRPSTLERALLQSAEAPIVIMAADGEEKLAPAVAPRAATLGFMLPYTPLHHLILQALETPIVATSGNVSDEPQCISNGEARERLSAIADFFLFHDRDIVNRIDDSVVRSIAGKPRVLRRARGYAPASLALGRGFEAAPHVLALGGELKNTICLLRRGEAVLSQHLGDLEHARAHSAYRETIALYQRLFEHAPAALAVDLHPEYLSTKLGTEWAAAAGLRLVEVQHHHAHIAACLAENRVPLDEPPVLGIALDGLGYGADGTLWGGEFLLADYNDYRRLAAFKPVAMPGGAQAIREPWRMAYAYLRQHADWKALQARHGNLQALRDLQAKPLRTLDAMLDAGINVPLTSSCGRLFDAVAALMGLRHEVTYEGQAAIELESAVDMRALSREEAYRFDLSAGHSAGLVWIDSAPMWPALLDDLANGCVPGVVAARFHSGIVEAITAMVLHLTRAHGNPWRRRVAVSGGVFQNAIVSTALAERLESAGYTVYAHSAVPANDGGVALGQAVVAAARCVSTGA